jgi:hypothetical protein
MNARAALLLLVVLALRDRTGLAGAPDVQEAAYSRGPATREGPPLSASEIIIAANMKAPTARIAQTTRLLI